ncbi:Two-component sensor histidine kinase, contains HisKA and HATPase domains [Chitinophaga sp. YR627]|nr:Two-component sensor histidine kinase, contains HisKA and HATPase domains [Chitinophaga sp. YR627]
MVYTKTRQLPFTPIGLFYLSCAAISLKRRIILYFALTNQNPTMYRHILFCWLLLLPCTVLNAQLLHNQFPPSYNTDMQRLLLLSTGNYLYGISQGQLDRDSALLFVTGTYNVSRLMPYNEGYKTGSDYPGQALIDAGRIAEATSLVHTMKGTARLQLLAELSNYYLHRPGSEPADLEEAGTFMRQLQQESQASGDNFWLLQSYWLLGTLYADMGDIAKSQPYFSQAVALCRKSGEKRSLVRSLIYQANGLPVGTPQKENYFREAFKIAGDNKWGMLEYNLMHHTILEHLRTNPPVVEKEMMDALAKEKEIGYLHHQYSYSNISYMHGLRGDAIKGVRYADLAVQAMEATKDTAFSTVICMRLAQMFNNAGEVKMSYLWNDRALSIPLTKETQILWYKSFLAKVSLLRRENQPLEALKLIDKFNHQYPPETVFNKMMLSIQAAGAYEESGNMQKALEQYLLFLENVKNFPPQFVYAETLTAYSAVARFYLITGHFDLARKYASLTLEHPIGKISAPDLAATYNLLYRIDSSTGNYLSALKHMHQYMYYRDSVFSISQRKAMDGMIIKYETQKKDQDIRLLKQDTQLQKAKLSRSAMVGKITLGSIALLLVIVGLLYNQYRIKRKASQDALTRNIALQQLVEEKEWLLREVHHRVKNNLQTIVSLLESQSAYLQNEALLAIQESQNRIYAMSLIHQKLYHDENVSSVNMGVYLPELVQYLRLSYNVKNNLLFNVQVHDVELDVSQAIPLGLIVNEAVTNAIKYAFPVPQTGNSISISLLTNNERAQLTIKDNGIGISKETMEGKIRGLGLKLIRGLANDIDGELLLKNDGGASIAISFEISQPLHSVAGNTSAAATA